MPRDAGGLVHELSSQALAVRLLLEALESTATPEQREVLAKVAEALSSQGDLLRQLEALVVAPSSRRDTRRA